LEDVEKRIKQLESEGVSGTLTKLSSKVPSPDSNKKKASSYNFNDDEDLEESIASGNIDEMEFSVGEETGLSPAESNSDDSDLYSFLDNKPKFKTSKEVSIKEMSNNNNKRSAVPSSSISGEFSMSEEEIEAFTSGSYDFTTNVNPPDKK
jgi:hypothetical protein